MEKGRLDRERLQRRESADRVQEERLGELQQEIGELRIGLERMGSNLRTARRERAEIAATLEQGERTIHVQRERLEQEMGNDDSDEEFWLALPTTDNRTNHVQSIPTQPSCSYPGRAVRSRVGALEVACELSRKGYG